MSNSILTNDRYDRYTQRHEWANDNRHICYLPYSSLQFFHSSKYVSPCCNLIKTEETNFLRPIIQIKEAIANKQTYQNCSVCYQCEDNGKISERTRYLIELTDEQLDKFLQSQEANETYIHCTLSNLCNMACRSCNIYTSSLFAKIETGKEIKTNTISDDMMYWNAMLDSISSAVLAEKNPRVVISGGEGFVQPDFKKLLNWMINEKISDKINLTINTNGIVDNEKLIQYLCDNFKSVSLAVSVDSIYENYHYVRWPMQWDKIESNLDTFAHYRNTRSNFDFFLTPVWSINNIFYVDDWILYFEGFKEKYNFPYFFAYDTPLFQPSWLDIRYMPEYLKKEAVARLNTVIDNVWLVSNKGLHANIKNLISLLNEPEIEGNEWNAYLRKTAEWDVKTKASASTYNTKMFSLLNDKDRQQFESYRSSFETN